ncbi:MAG: hypothetical protein AAB480_04780 [Patescibacteria group bacterium]
MYIHPIRASIIILSIFFAATAIAFLTSGGSAHAQSTKPVVVATVNIYDAKITAQEGNTFSISFDLSNREGAQPDVRYAVELVSAQQAVVAEQVYPDVVNLESNSHVVKSIRYTAPAYLSGTYQMRLVSKNTSGLSLARASLGSVTLAGQSSYAEIIPSTCFLTVAGEAGDKKYTLEQGVDIATSETLNLTCTIKNHSRSALTLTPSFETFYRNVFGPQVETPMPPVNAISVGAGAGTTFTVVLPKAPVPQAYDARLSFTNTSAVPVNSVIAHYVLRGTSATIQNLTLDRTSYAAGDTALISLFWTGSASNFFNARTAPAALSGVQAAVSIAGSAGSCGSDVTVTLDQQRSTQAIPFPVTGACDSPNVSIRLADSAGNVLASSAFDFRNTASSEKGNGGGTLIYAIIAVVVLALLYVVWRMFAGKTADTATTLVLAGLCIVSFGLPSAAYADTFTQDVYLVSSGGWAGNFTFTYDVNLNKATYAPGETMTAAGNVTMGNCGNSLTGSFTATINAQHKDVYRSILRVLGQNNYHVEATISSNTFTAPMSPGTYIAQFFPELHVPNAGPGAGSYFLIDTGTGGGGDEEGQDSQGASMGWGGRGGNMVRDWVGTTPYEMPYTVSGVCTPTAITCQGGNLVNNCGQTTSCQYGCTSTPTPQCNTSSCTPTSITCNPSTGNLVNNCGQTATTCPYGCTSTPTPRCNTTCQPHNVCNADGTKVLNSCTGAVVRECTTDRQKCVAGACVDQSIEFESFDGTNVAGGAFTATGHLQVIPSLVKKGDTTRVYWNVTGAKNCTVAGSNGDGTQGSLTGVWNTKFSGAAGKTTSPIMVKTTYTLLCQAFPGITPAMAEESAIVNVLPSFQEL